MYSLYTQPRKSCQMTSHHDSSWRQPSTSMGEPSGMTPRLGNSVSGPVRMLTFAVEKAGAACAETIPAMAKPVTQPASFSTLMVHSHATRIEPMTIL